MNRELFSIGWFVNVDCSHIIRFWGLFFFFYSCCTLSICTMFLQKNSATDLCVLPCIVTAITVVETCVCCCLLTVTEACVVGLKMVIVTPNYWWRKLKWMASLTSVSFYIFGFGYEDSSFTWERKVLYPLYYLTCINNWELHFIVGISWLH